MQIGFIEDHANSQRGQHCAETVQSVGSFGSRCPENERYKQCQCRATEGCQRSDRGTDCQANEKEQTRYPRLDQEDLRNAFQAVHYEVQEVKIGNRRKYLR